MPPYSKQTWVNNSGGGTKVNATRLAHIEAGIDAANVAYNVKAYGAVGDGATNDTTAVEAAITASGWPSVAARVVFPAGIYKVPNGITLDGAGATSTPPLTIEAEGATLLTTTASAVLMTITNSIVSTTFVTVRGMAFNSNAVGAIGVVLENAEACLFDGCRFGGSFSTGVKFSGTSTYNTFKGCVFANMARGMWLDGSAHYLTVANSSFIEELSGSPLNWIEASNGSTTSDNVKIVGCQFYGTGATLPLVRAKNGATWTIVGNNFTLAPVEALWIGRDGSASGITVMGNTFDHGLGHDIYIDGGRTNTITGNTFGVKAGGITVSTYSCVRIANTFGGAAGSDNVIVGNRSIPTGTALLHFVHADSGCANLTVVGNDSFHDISVPDTGSLISSRASLISPGPIQLQAAATIYSGSGAPGGGLGANGDFYFRTGGTVGANTVMYHKESGSWVAFTTT